MNDPLIMEFGWGSSLRRGDYTQAAERAVRHALWRNSINLAELFGFEKTDMQIAVRIGAADPEAVDREAIAKIFPYGDPTITVVKGGLDVPRPEGEGQPTVMVQAALSVSFKMERADG